LRHPAGPSGLTLYLYADDPTVLGVPVSVFIPAGQTSVTFTAQTAPVFNPYTATLYVEQDVESVTTLLEVFPL
jgi:hypothetical protein